MFSAGSNDFTSIPLVLTFQPSTTELCVNISVSRDVVLEDDEVFTVQLNTSDKAVLLSLSSANVTIVDNDSKGSLDGPIKCFVYSTYCVV